MRVGRSIITVLVCLCPCSTALASISAGVIPNRATLNSHLVTSTAENFESYVTGNNTGVTLLTPTLDSTTVANGQGPNLLKPGFQLRGTWSGGASDGFQWNSTAYVGSTSRQLHTHVSTNTTTARPTMVIDFASPVGAFGLDMSAYCQGYDDIATATVFAANDITVLYQSGGINLPSPPNAPQTYIFFGYEDPAGIGSVVLTPTNRPWSPILDNLTFGQVPEPTAASILLVAILASAGRRGRAKSAAPRCCTPILR